MNNKRNKEGYIDLQELIGALIRRLGLIILAVLVFGLGGFCYSYFFTAPLYSADAMMIVNSGERYPDYVSTDQLNSATSLIDTYSIIFRSDRVMGEVVSNLGLEDVYEKTVRGVAVTSVNDTQVMNISVTATDPQIALDVCREITNVAPDVIVDTVEAGSVRLVSEAHTTFRPVSPNIPRNTVISALIGLVLAAGLIIVRTLMDNKISGENDIRMFELPVLGVIPTYEAEE